MFYAEIVAPQAESGEYFQIWFFRQFGGKKGACKLSCTLFSPARVQPLNGAGRKESSGTGLGLAMIFLRDSLWLSAVSLSRKQHDILDFSYCPLSRVSPIGKDLDLSFI